MKEIQKYDGIQVVSWDKCDWKPKEVAAPAKLKLSDAIRIGASMTPQTVNLRWIDVENCRSCAVGAAWVGYHGKLNIAAYHSTPYPFAEHVGSLFGVSHDFMKEVSTKFEALRSERRNDARERIADWVESQGF